MPRFFPDVFPQGDLPCHVHSFTIRSIQYRLRGYESNRLCKERKAVMFQPTIFTDLDGTFLDHDTYSFAVAVPTLGIVEQKQIPLVFCSSKTRTEILRWRERLGNHDPFISENGGGIFVPTSSFAKDDIRSVWPRAEMIDTYFVLVLGKPHTTLRKTMKDHQRKGSKSRGLAI